MIRKLITIMSVLGLSFGMLVMPASAEGTPSDSEAACVAAGGVFTSTGPVLTSETAAERTWETTNECEVTTYSVDRVDTAHKNFAVDFEIETITTYTTVYTQVDAWEIVGYEQGPSTIAWICINPGGETVGPPWGDGTGDPTVGAPNQGQCQNAAEAYPDGFANNPQDPNNLWFVELGEIQGEDIPVYDWVDGNPYISDQYDNAVSSVIGVLGCWNYQMGGGTGGYIGGINNHCQQVIDAN